MADYRKFRSLTDEEWLRVLQRSVLERPIEGVDFGRFPPAELQAQFVGSSNENALKEAWNFYLVVKSYAEALGMRLGDTSRLLDFGCGWGRFLRVFARDVSENSLFGVDVDPEIARLCEDLGVPGKVSRVGALGSLDFPDGHFSHIIAYSVFTHLPEDVMHHWLTELSRVARPGCVFVVTVEPPRFLDFVDSIDKTAASQWHQGLKAKAGDVSRLRAELTSRGLAYIPTGGGKYRDASIYGDVVVSERYITQYWAKYFRFVRFIDDPAQFWQAVVIMQKG